MSPTGRSSAAATMLISVTQQPVVTLYDATLQLHGLSLLNQATKGRCDCGDEGYDDSESVITVKHQFENIIRLLLVITIAMTMITIVVILLHRLRFEL